MTKHINIDTNLVGEMTEWADLTIRETSDALIARGIKPHQKKYSKVRPKGFYILLPSMWRKAKLIEQVNDYSYDQIMNDVKIAVGKEFAKALEGNSK